MNIQPFLVEEWMNAWEEKARYNIAETCCDSISLETLFDLAGEDLQAFFSGLSRRRLTYGAIEGRPDFLEGICGLYDTLRPDEVIPTHGAAGANHLLFYSLVEPGDEVICVQPTYQQLYGIPAGYGARVRLLQLREEDGWLPDPDALRALVTPATRLICLNNPNNPTGALMDGAQLKDIVGIARSCGAWILCDEVYRHLTQEDCRIPSVADLYERGISVSGMSKVFSLAGLRLGWIASHDAALRKACMSHRDYSLISCGMLDEAVAAVALRHADQLLRRNRELIRSNLRTLEAWIKRMDGLISHVTPRAGTTSLLRYTPELDSYTFARRLLEETGAFLTPGDCFGRPGTLRIGYACDGETLRGGLDALGCFLRSL